jgi:hypothetical protein
VGEDFITAVHAGQVLCDEVLKEEVVEFAVGGGQAYEPWQGTGDGDYAEDLRAGAAALGAEQQGKTESLVEDARKGMGGVDGDGRQERVDLALKVALSEGAGFVVEFLPRQQTNAMLAELREELLIPALVLGCDELVDVGGEDFKGLVGAKAVVSGLAIAVFNALHESGLAHLNVLVKIVGGDGEEFYALQEGVGGVLGFLEDAPIELHPGVIPSVEELLFVRSLGHRSPSSAVLAVYKVFPGGGSLNKSNEGKHPMRQLIQDAGGKRC